MGWLGQYGEDALTLGVVERPQNSATCPYWHSRGQPTVGAGPHPPGLNRVGRPVDRVGDRLNNGRVAITPLGQELGTHKSC